MHHELITRATRHLHGAPNVYRTIVFGRYRMSLLWVSDGYCVNVGGSQMGLAWNSGGSEVGLRWV